MVNQVGATESTQISTQIIQREYVVAGAGVKGEASNPYVDKAKAYLEAIHEKGSFDAAIRSLKAQTEKPRRASFDRNDPTDTLSLIRDKKVKDEVAAKMESARVQMAAIDVLRLSTPDAQNKLFDKLKKDGKIPNDISSVDDLVKKATELVVAEGFFQEYFKDYNFNGTSQEEVAQKLFLEGSRADIRQGDLSEGFGLLQKKILELPAVPIDKKAQLEKDKDRASRMRKGAEDEINSIVSDIIEKTGGDISKIDASVKADIIRAAGMADTNVREEKLAEIIAKQSHIPEARIPGILTYEKNVAELAQLRSRNNDADKARITKLEADINDAQNNPDSTSFMADVAKYAHIRVQVQSSNVHSTSESYRLYRQRETDLRIEVRSLDDPDPTKPSKEQKARDLAEADLIMDVYRFMEKGLYDTVLSMTEDLSDGALKTAQAELEDLEKKGETEKAKVLAKYIDSFTVGNDALIKQKIEQRNGKDFKAEEIEIDNIERELVVLADNDTHLGSYGSKFMVAYRAGFFQPFPDSYFKEKHTDGEYKIALRANSNSPLPKLAKQVLEGKMSAAMALSGLDADTMKKVDAFCTDERMTGYRTQVFGDYARAQRYIEESGPIWKNGWLGKKIREFKGYSVSINGDPNKLKLMMNHWDKLMEVHETQIENAIGHSDEAKKWKGKLEKAGWVMNEQNKKRLYYLLMLLGIITFPVIGVTGMAAAGLGSVGAAEIAGMEVAGAAAGAGVASRFKNGIAAG